jgi:hypothetical protein
VTANANLTSAQTYTRLLEAGIDVATARNVEGALLALELLINKRYAVIEETLSQFQAVADVSNNLAEQNLAVLIVKTNQFVDVGKEAVDLNVTVAETEKVADTSTALQAIADVNLSLAET